jgi:outer membrane protein TolC
MLSLLPERAVTLDLVLSRAIQRSDSYRSVIAQEQASDVPYLRGRIPLETRVYGKSYWLDNRNETPTVFQPVNIESRSILFGASSAFLSGASLNFEVSQNSVEQTITNTRNQYYESKAQFTVTQNLWQDSFGAATRATATSGELGREAAKAAVEVGVQDWAASLMDVFYASWLAQARVFTARDNLARRERLESITKIRERRGTSEEPDLLQVTSARINASVQLSEAEQILGERWRGLVVSLKLPDSWIAIDPRLIPIRLDDPISSAREICRKAPRGNDPTPETASVRRREFEFRAAENALRAAESKMHPDLELVAGVTANGINPRERSDSFTETRRFEHPNWLVGVNLTVPLSRHAEKLERSQAIANRDFSSALASDAREQSKLDWLNQCRDLERMLQSTERLAQAFANQSKRARLEERRFEIGRGTILSVIQAGDDATASELSLRNAEASLRRTAWRVQRLNDGYKERIAAWKTMETPGL